jgi:hypothetical protein
MAGKIVADIIESAGSQISLNVGNVTILTASSTGLTLTPTTNVNINLTNSIVTLTNGSATAPGLTFSGNTRTGLFMPSANTLAFTAANTEVMRIDSSGNVGIGTNSPAAKLDVRGSSTFLINSSNPTAWVSSDSGLTTQSMYMQVNTTSSDTRLGSYTSHPLVFLTNNTERMRIDTTGRVMINTTTADARLSVHTDGTNTAVGYGLALVNDAGGGNTWTLQCGHYAVNNGKFTIYDKTNNKYPFLIDASTMYITMPGVYALTSGSAANVFVATDGTLYRSTSSLKYKTNVQNATHGLTELLTLRPVTYKGKTDGDKIFGGLIAEEVHEAGLTEFVQYAEDGTPDALAYSNMVSLCIKSIQELKAIVDAQAVEIAALKAK